MMQHHATVEPFERAQRVREEIAIRGGEGAALVASSRSSLARERVLCADQLAQNLRCVPQRGVGRVRAEVRELVPPSDLSY
jgi:hypothetical protein